MKSKTSQILLICITACLLLFNISLLYKRKQDNVKLEKLAQSLKQFEQRRDVASMFQTFKEIIVKRFQYEQLDLSDKSVYTGSDRLTLTSVRNLINHPKFVLGLSQDMCSPCVEGVLTDLKAVFQDYETNANILIVADIEQRFKNNYYNKKVVSFQQKNDFPLYELAMPYLFILDKDLSVKLLHLTDKSSPEVTREYLKMIRKRYPEL